MNFQHLRPAVAILTLIIVTAFISWQQSPNNDRSFYCLRVYHFQTSEQEQALDNYFEKTLLPALHRQQIKSIGVFNAVANDTAAEKVMYVFIPFKSAGDFLQLDNKLNKDNTYTASAIEFLNPDYKTPAFSRMETILLNAFELAPDVKTPQLKSAKPDRVYELRSYESPTDAKFRSKVKMFNQGDEIGLFKKLSFNAVFYGEVIAGGKMPNLMYLTCFESIADRDEHWKKFSNDPKWKQLTAMPEYEHNVSRAEINFLRPTSYSDL